MLVSNAARGSTGAVDEQSMPSQNAARGSTGGVDEQSMVVSNAARCSTGGFDEQSTVVSVANHAFSDAPPGWGFTVLQFQGGKIRSLNISKFDFIMKALPKNPSHHNPPTQVHKMRS